MKNSRRTVRKKGFGKTGCVADTLTAAPFVCDISSFGIFFYQMEYLCIIKQKISNWREINRI
jgi:hypothetical protein